jgi:hypothetical protein
MDDRRKSDTAVVPKKSRNAVDVSTGDAREGRAVANGKSRKETGNSGSPRSCTTYTTWHVCERPTSR